MCSEGKLFLYGKGAQGLMTHAFPHCQSSAPCTVHGRLFDNATALPLRVRVARTYVALARVSTNTAELGQSQISPNRACGGIEMYRSEHRMLPSLQAWLLCRQEAISPVLKMLPPNKS